MSRIVKAGLIQCANPINDDETPVELVRHAAYEHAVRFVENAGNQGVQVLCLPELFAGPYFCPGANDRWFGAAETIPGPTTDALCPVAAKHEMVIVASLFEQDGDTYYNAAAVIDADGRYLGKYRKTHVPNLSGFPETFFFSPGNLGYPVFPTAYANVGVSICYDRHFPEVTRALALNGAEIVLNPASTTAGLSQRLWTLEHPAHAVANGIFIGAANRVGLEPPPFAGRFFGTSYFCNPRGDVVARGSETDEEIVVAELDFAEIEATRRHWPFVHDRRPDTYQDLTAEPGEGHRRRIT